MSNSKNTAQTNYDILDRILSESQGNSNVQDARKNFTPLQRKDGTWINTFDEYLQLTMNVSEIEAYLRS